MEPSSACLFCWKVDLEEMDRYQCACTRTVRAQGAYRCQRNARKDTPAGEFVCTGTEQRLQVHHNFVLSRRGGGPRNVVKASGILRVGSKCVCTIKKIVQPCKGPPISRHRYIPHAPPATACLRNQMWYISQAKLCRSSMLPLIQFEISQSPEDKCHSTWKKSYSGLLLRQSPCPLG